MSDDDLRDAFGAQITEALELRSRSDAPTETVLAARQADRQGFRRRLLVAALVVAIVAAAVPLLIARTRGTDRVGTVNAGDTTTGAPRTSTSASIAPSTTTASTTAPPVKPIVPVRLVTPAAVGSLRFGVATAADVRTTIGVPEASVRGSFGVSTLPGYLALGYECASTKAPGRMHIGPNGTDRPPYCRTVFYINVNTATLAGFATTTTHYATAAGTKVDMTGAEAQLRESRPVVGGCFSGIRIGEQTTPFAAMFAFVAVYSNNQVNGISVDNPANSVGVLFC